MGFLVAIATTFLIKFGIYFGTKYLLGHAIESDFVSYMMFPTVFAAVFLFLFCLNVKINIFSQKLIGVFAPVSLGVYLIHSHPFVFRYVLEERFLPFTKMPIVAMVGCVLLAMLAIYLLCACIEWLRIQLFKLICINRLCVFLEEKIAYYYTIIFKE